MEENTKRINDVYDYLIYRHIINGQEDMANALKTSRPNITSMLSGKKSVTTETLRKINERNRITNYSGSLFTQNRAVLVTTDDEWLEDHNVTW